MLRYLKYLNKKLAFLIQSKAKLCIGF
jgi:hypothetical protein